MGGRRKSNKIQKKEKPISIKTIFDCGICGYKNCILVKIKKIIKQADLLCDKCGTNFHTTVRCMDEPIDVYHKWLKVLKEKKQVNNQQENRFEDQMSQPEGLDVEQILKEDDKEFSEDSLNQAIPVHKLEQIDDNDLSEDSLAKIQSQEQESEMDSLISGVDESDDEDQPRKKVKA